MTCSIWSVPEVSTCSRRSTSDSDRNSLYPPRRTLWYTIRSPCDAKAACKSEPSPPVIGWPSPATIPVRVSGKDHRRVSSVRLTNARCRPSPDSTKSRSCPAELVVSRSGTPIHEDECSSTSTRQRFRRRSEAPSKYKYLAPRAHTNRPSVTPLGLSHSRASAENVAYCAGPPSIGTVANDHPSSRRRPQMEMRCPSGCHALETFVNALATLPSTSRGDDPSRSVM